LSNGYHEFAVFDCVSCVSKSWYSDFLYNVLASEIDLLDVNNIEEKMNALVKHGFLPQPVFHQKNIYEQDMYLVINDPLFIEGLNRSGIQEEVLVAKKTIPKFPNIYEEPVSRAR
jgi:hypothetical protein